MGNLDNKKDNLVGKAKEAAGNATGNEQLANEGKGDQVTSSAKEKASDAAQGAKDKANEALGGLKDN